MTSDPPRIIFFGPEIRSEAESEYYGNKAAVLATISGFGIPVPPGFALSVDICEEFFKNNGILPDDVPELIRQGIAFIERSTTLRYGDRRRPLIVSVRSGAPVSMPGVMETILDLGLNKTTIRGLISLTGNPKFAWDTYRRFLENFGTVVFSHDPGAYRKIVQEVMAAEQVSDEVALDFSALRSIAEQEERLYTRINGNKLPEDVFSQLELAATAVLQSWDSPRAQSFRSLNLVSGARGTGVTVQAMVYGNLSPLSGSGVAFSRNPWTGENSLIVDFKFGAQGEDIVSGNMGVVTQQEFEARIPLAARELADIAKRLEHYYRDMQDIEFTVQDGKLFILQSRSGKRAPLASLKIAVELVQESIIGEDEAFGRIRDIDTDNLTVQTIAAKERPIATGISASMGVVSGKIALTSVHAVECAKTSPVILVRETATPDDMPGIGISAGILTSRGARTSHAAVVARQMGKVCIVSCTDLEIDTARHRCKFPGGDLYEGDTITLDGMTGNVYAGRLDIIVKRPDDLLGYLQKWKEKREFSRMKN